MGLTMNLLQSVNMKTLGLLAALTLTAACASKNADSAAATGGATAQPAVAGQTAAGPAPGTEEHFLVNVQDRVFFGYDRYDLDSQAREVLARQASWMQQYPNVSVVVEGHCDERGTREYNLALGARRATAVKDYLVGLGIAPNRIQTISYGKERPVAPGSNQPAWRLNRRGVTTVETGYGS